MSQMIVWCIKFAVEFVKDSWLERSREKRFLKDAETLERTKSRLASQAQARKTCDDRNAEALCKLFRQIQKHRITIANISRDVLDGRGLRFKELYAAYREEVSRLKEVFWCSEICFPRTVVDRYSKYEAVVCRYELAYRRISDIEDTRGRFLALPELEYEENVWFQPLRDAIKHAMQKDDEGLAQGG